MCDLLNNVSVAMIDFANLNQMHKTACLIMKLII